MAALIVTLVGPDRPGLVSTLSAAVTECGGNWLESRMARLAGQFAGIVLVDMPPDAPARLRDRLGGLRDEGFHIDIRSGAPDALAADSQLNLEVVGQDRPGIVRDITALLARRGVNIEELTTHVSSGSFSGEVMFRAAARLRVPHGLSHADIAADLEQLGHDLIVDLAPAADGA